MAINETKTQFKPNALGAEKGTEGIREFYGHVSESYISNLEWPEAYDIYSKMWRRDPSLRSLVLAIKLLSRQAIWTSEPFSVLPADKKASNFLIECMNDMSITIPDFIDDVLSCVPLSWSSFETVYKRRSGATAEIPSLYSDGKVGWKKFAFRRQSSFNRWELDDGGGFRGWWQVAAPKFEEVFLPSEELLHFVFERDGNNPEGLALFESAYEMYHFVVNLQIISGIGWQRAFVGLPHFHFQEKPSSADKADVQAIGQGLTVAKNQFVSTPPGVDFKLESTSNNNASSLLDTIKMYRAQMLQTVMAEFLMAGQLGGGVLSQGSGQSDKSEMFLMVVNGLLDKIASVWTKFGVKRLFEFDANKIPEMTGLPRIIHTEVKKPDLVGLGQFLSQISNLVPLGEEDHLWIRQQARMPEIIPKNSGGQTEENKEFRESIVNDARSVERIIGGVLHDLGKERE